MRRSNVQSFGVFASAFTICVLAVACGAPTSNSNLTAVNTNVGIPNSLANSNLNTSAAPGSIVETREPEQYQAMVKLTLQSMGGAQQGALPSIGANVARSGADRMMEFTLPTSEKVIFLDKGGMNYLILPGRKQYAELTKETLGFEVRRLLMPEQIVSQVKGMSGVKMAGEENMNGRQVVKYTYQTATNTQTQAGTVATESYMLVDKETGLPLRTETVSQSQSGGNVQGVSGIRVVTEMTDIKTTPDASAFVLPTDYQKIDSETVKTQVNFLFSVVGNFIGQAINTNQTRPATTSNLTTNTNTSPSPMR